ncbi:TonB-dependent receptor domain-containing protein [Marinicella sp. W31]|uniref:TonB-dependent receptor domain-containing protein n=1 Tax=Marinicella sp. W31 TaxID=3023713 RepID=UPI003756F9EE
MNKHVRFLSAMVCFCVVLGVSQAQESMPLLSTDKHRLDIVSQPLVTAVHALSEKTGMQIIFFNEIGEGVTSSKVMGSYTANEALSRMLEGSGLYMVDLGRSDAIGISSGSASGHTETSQMVPQVNLVAQVNVPEQTTSENRTSSPVAAAEEEEDTETLDTVVVTGSKIPKASAISAIPIQVISSFEIDQSGFVDLGEILEDLPGVSLGLSPEGTLTSTQNAGLSSVSLRSLGSNRTLALLNGFRNVSNSGNAQRIDLGTIPTGMIDRVEISTGGASAVYGSDAIAGVVNIVLRERYEGLRSRIRYGTSEGGGEDEKTAEVTWGQNFANDRGNILMSFTYDDETAVFGRDRGFAILPVDFDDGVFEPNGALSSSIPGGRFEGDDAWNVGGVWFNDQSLAPNDGRDPSDGFETDLDGFNFRPEQVLSPARERLLGGLKAQYNFANNVEASLFVLYSNIETFSGRSAAAANNSTDFGAFDAETDIGNIASDHPFIPPEVEETRSGSVSWRRRFTEVGGRTREADRETLRFAADFKGFFADSSWEWKGHLGYGTYDQDQVRTNGLNYQNIQFALDIEDDPNNPGGYRCADAGARANGCVPLNIFGEGTVTSQMADYIRSNARFQNELEHRSLSFSAVGEVAELPAGIMYMAAGIEYRKEEQSGGGDLATIEGNTSHGAIPELNGEYDVNEAFVEVNVPILSDRPGFEELYLESAFRLADYSTIGSTNSWKLGLNWAINDSFRVRAQVSTAERAPDITELFSALRGDVDSVDDPCDGVTLDSSGAVAQNCLTDTGILAAINEFGLYEQESSSIFGPNGGNLDLQEETADTFTAGFIWTPQYVEGLSLIVDYYDIEIEDAISSVSSQDTLDLCYNSQTFPNNRFCDVISRNSIGQISRIINQQENLNALISSGVDVTLAYDFELASVPGEFDFETKYSYVDKLESRFVGPDGSEAVNEFKGEVGDSEHQARVIFGWRDGTWRLRYRVRYLSSALDDNNLSPEDIDFLKVDDYMRHDLYAHYEFGRKDRFRVFLGINNIGDNNGPFLPSGTNSGSSRNFSSAYDPVGRFFYTGLNVKWY